MLAQFQVADAVCAVGFHCTHLAFVTLNIIFWKIPPGHFLLYVQITTAANPTPGPICAKMSLHNHLQKMRQPIELRVRDHNPQPILMIVLSARPLGPFCKTVCRHFPFVFLTFFLPQVSGKRIWIRPQIILRIVGRLNFFTIGIIQFFHILLSIV